MFIKVILHPVRDKPVDQLCDCGLIAGEALELLMGYASPLHPAVGILGFVQLPRPAEAVHGELEFLIGKVDRISLELFLDQTYLDELVGNSGFLPDEIQARYGLIHLQDVVINAYQVCIAETMNPAQRPWESVIVTIAQGYGSHLRQMEESVVMYGLIVGFLVPDQLDSHLGMPQL